MKTFALAGAAVAALASTAAAAQPRPDGRSFEPLTRASVASRVEAGFARFDADRDGVLTHDEIRARVEDRRADRGEGRGQRAEHRGDRDERRAERGERQAELFARLDTDRDGSISRAEFEARPRLSPEERAERRAERGEHRSMRGMRHGGGLFAGVFGRRFAAADVDGDGRLTQAEARRSALALFDGVDTDRDGTISAEERRAARDAFGGRRQG
jgi:Ca2+-binding EF-hand superfamily protein